MADITFDQLMQGFGVVTVMNACIYKLKDNRSYVGRGACQHGSNDEGALTKDDFYCTGLYLDTLKIANFTQEGPTKTITGGQYANPLIKYGKTMTCEMQDALGRAAVMQEFFGCDYDAATKRLSVTDRFPGAFAIEGDTFFIDQKTGKKVDVHILIPQFLPEGILTLTQDAEGDATVFDLNGSVSVTKIVDQEGDTPRSIFYEIRKERWFGLDLPESDAEKESDYHEPQNAEYAYFYVGNELYAAVNCAATPYVGPADPAMPGYTFDGWFKLGTDGKFTGDALAEGTAPAKDDKYYAKFSLKA